MGNGIIIRVEKKESLGKKERSVLRLWAKRCNNYAVINSNFLTTDLTLDAHYCSMKKKMST